MSQQQWGGNLNWGQSTLYNPVAPYQQGQPYAAGPGPGYPSGPAVPVAPFGTGSPMPQPKRRNPMRLALLAILAVAVLAVGGLVIAGLSAQPAQVAYANDEYQVPPPDSNPPQVLIPQSAEEAQRWMKDNAVYPQTLRLRCGAPRSRSTWPRRATNSCRRTSTA